MKKSVYLDRCDKFFKKWLGKKDDFDGAYNNQCVDTSKRFFFEVCDIPNPPATGNGWAHGYWYNRTTIPQIYKNFLFITDKSKLQTGDVVITSHPHVAIYHNGKLFGQNHGGNLEANAWTDFSNFSSKFLGALRYKHITEDSKPWVRGDAYTECAKAVISGEYGNGHDKRADNIYNRVRTWVNNCLLKGVTSGCGYIDSIVRDVIDGRHGNGHENRKASIYKIVREEVNKLV